MSDQFQFRRNGGQIKTTGEQQSVFAANPDRVCVLIGNDSARVIEVFADQMIQVRPWLGILIPPGYLGEVLVKGHYTDRFIALEMVKERST